MGKKKIEISDLGRRWNLESFFLDDVLMEVKMRRDAKKEKKKKKGGKNG